MRENFGETNRECAATDYGGMARNAIAPISAGEPMPRNRITSGNDYRRQSETNWVRAVGGGRGPNDCLGSTLARPPLNLFSRHCGRAIAVSIIGRAGAFA
jgi:hypothetical protein